MSLPSKVQPLMIQWTMRQPAIRMAPKSGRRLTTNLVWYGTALPLYAAPHRWIVLQEGTEAMLDAWRMLTGLQ